MRRALVGVGVGFLLVACKAGVGSSGVQVEKQPATANVKVDADAKKGGETKKPQAPPGMSEADAEAVCTAIRTPDCDRQEKCSPKTLISDYGDKATCVRRQVAQCKVAFMLPGVKISMEQGKACGASVAARACDATDPINECRFHGTIPDDGACINGDGCVSGYCEGGNAIACGKCKARPAPKGGAAVGAACKADGDCNNWARCDGGKCVPAGKAKGGKCDQEQSCNYAQGLGCRSAKMCYEVTSAVDVGASCKQDDATKTVPACKLGRCDRASNKCQALKAEGEACKSGECQTDLVCDEATKKCGVVKVDLSVCWK